MKKKNLKPQKIFLNPKDYEKYVNSLPTAEATKPMKEGVPVFPHFGVPIGSSLVIKDASSTKLDFEIKNIKMKFQGKL